MFSQCHKYHELLRCPSASFYLRHLRAMASSRKSKTEKIKDNRGVVRLPKENDKDPDKEFMKLWKSSEAQRKIALNELISGKKSSMKRPGGVNILNLPFESELTKEEESLLLGDRDDIGYTIPKFTEFIQGLKLTKREVKHRHDTKISKNSETTFEELGVHPKLIAKLEKDGIFQPVHIQQQALPLIFNNQSVLIKSETGSGKTLVFLLPAVQDPGRSFGSVIIVPTRELASQMLYEAHRLLRDKSIIASFVSGVDLSDQEKRLEDTVNPPRIVIGTPKRLLEIMDQKESLFIRTKRIVVDEVDKVFATLRKRAPVKKMVSRAMHPRPGLEFVRRISEISRVPKKQFIGASATVEPGLLEELSDVGWGDNVNVVQTPGYSEGKLRSMPSTIEHCYTLYDEKTGLSKANILARAFSSSGQKSALVFIHRKLSVDDFVWELRYFGLQAVSLYRMIAKQDPKSHEMFLSDFHSGKFQLVVGTEETVRGLDFRDLKHVYLTEVPKNVGEYVHLAGRVGRQGKTGTVTTIVSENVVGEKKRMLLQYRRLEVPYRQV